MKNYTQFINEKNSEISCIKNNFTEEYENYLVKKNAKKYNIL